MTRAIRRSAALITLTLATACVPDARRQANELSAIARLRSIRTAEMSYATVCGNGDYAAAMKTLQAPFPGTTEPLLSLPPEAKTLPDGGIELTGYVFRLKPGGRGATGPADCGGTPTNSAFYATAEPVTAGSGGRSFAVIADGTIWFLDGGRAPTEPFGPPAKPVQ